MSKPRNAQARNLQDYSRLTDEQLTAVKKLVKKCCNYYQGSCMALDEGNGCPCVQSFSYSLICKWFRNAVLPLDPVLESKLQNIPLKRCERCGKEFAPKSNHAKYCEPCGKIRRREKEATRVRNLYSKNLRI